MIKSHAESRAIEGILLQVDRQQILLQYAGNTSLTLCREEQLVKHLILIFNTFCDVFGLIHN